MHPQLDLHGVLQDAYREDCQREAIRQRIMKLAASRGQETGPLKSQSAKSKRRRAGVWRLLLPRWSEVTK
ncbi:MAG: hypothetical protein ACLFWD_01205 [Anaerolineales bacterium]